MTSANGGFRWPLLGHRGVSNGTPQAIASGTDNADVAIKYLGDLLSETREELTRADSKASLLLAAVGVIIGALVAGLTGHAWSPMELRAEVQWLWWLGVATAVVGVLSIASSVHPRFHRAGTPRPELPAYYGDVVAYKDIEGFRRAVEQVENSKDRLITQTFVLSYIVHRKYVLLRRGLWSLLAAIVACALSVIISALLS